LAHWGLGVNLTAFYKVALLVKLDW